MAYRNEMKQHKAGRLGEEFMLAQFGIREDEAHEIKGMSSDPGNVIIRFKQLALSIGKVYWVVKYDRDHHRHKLLTGPRKGKIVRRVRYTMEEAFEHKRVEVCASLGSHLIDVIVRKRQHLQVTIDKERHSTYYWRLRWNDIVADCRPVEHRGMEIWRHKDLHPEGLEPTPIQTVLPMCEAPAPPPSDPENPGAGLFDEDDIPY